MTITDEMIENGCRGMYGKHWDGPVDKMPGEEMKEVWRKYSRNCLTGALQRNADGLCRANQGSGRTDQD
jgi:hypothetical protein